MVLWDKLGYNDQNEYFADFSEKLLLSNHTYGFYVDWDKVYRKLEDSLFEISLLNSLHNVNENIEDKFRELLTSYPEVVPILPSILAIRERKVPVFDSFTKESKIIKFSKNSFDIDEVINFSIETGLLKLFSNIDDLYSYLLGTEVGLDSNARKNRSGHIFEDIVGDLLSQKIEFNRSYKLTKEDNTVPINRNKRFDFVLYENNIPKIAFECNFYNSQGSKPIEVAHAYVELQRDLNESNISFVWITDGQGWKKMTSTLSKVSEDIDLILNYRMLDEKFNVINNI